MTDALRPTELDIAPVGYVSRVFDIQMDLFVVRLRKASAPPSDSTALGPALLRTTAPPRTPVRAVRVPVCAPLAAHGDPSVPRCRSSKAASVCNGM